MSKFIGMLEIIFNVTLVKKVKDQNLSFNAEKDGSRVCITLLRHAGGAVVMSHHCQC